MVSDTGLRHRDLDTCVFPRAHAHAHPRPCGNPSRVIRVFTLIIQCELWMPLHGALPLRLQNVRARLITTSELAKAPPPMPLFRTS